MLAFEVSHPRRTLLGVFAAWKVFLLLIAVASGVRPAYDTSTTLISTEILSSNESAWDIATKLTRWDAIYFMHSARRGYLFEQEWAFGYGLPTSISLLVQALTRLGFKDTGSLEALVGITIAHTSHLLSALVLYQLGLKLLRNRRLSLLAALLHILSPAGIFLSAPYNESPFSLLTFTGYLLFAQGCLDVCRSLVSDLAIIGAGILFGIATLFRSNGLLNGIPYAVFAVVELSRLVKDPSFVGVRRLAAIGIGALYTALGSVGPQAFAYQIFCTDTSGLELRPWCTKWIPSIYTFVQERYWNVGFLRYWTSSNIPLFFLAAPMIYLLLRSGCAQLAKPTSAFKDDQGHQGRVKSTSDLAILLNSMALSQVILASMAVTTYHIQIITRMSSAYPIWYFWLAQKLSNPSTSSSAGRVVVFMVMYAAIQTCLFASFLPPA